MYLVCILAIRMFVYRFGYTLLGLIGLCKCNINTLLDEIPLASWKVREYCPILCTKSVTNAHDEWTRSIYIYSKKDSLPGI